MVAARSNAEGEFKTMAHRIYKLLWIKIILSDLGIKWEEPMKLYCDNKSVISIIYNPMQHDRIKHVEVGRDFIKEKLENGLICIHYIPIEDQLANILTNGLPYSAVSNYFKQAGNEKICQLEILAT